MIINGDPAQSDIRDSALMDVVSKLKITTESKDKLRIIFNLIEHLNIDWIDINELTKTLGYLSYKNINICNIYKKWIDRNTIIKDFEIKVGKYEDTMISEVDDNKWKMWFYKNVLCLCKKCNKCKILRYLQSELIEQVFLNDNHYTNNQNIDEFIKKLYLIVMVKNIDININIGDNKKYSNLQYKDVYDQKAIKFLSTQCDNNKSNCIICKSECLMVIIDRYDICKKCFSDMNNNYDETYNKYIENIINKQFKKEEEKERLRIQEEKRIQEELEQIEENKIQEEYERHRQILIQQNREFKNKQQALLEKSNRTRIITGKNYVISDINEFI
jgi:hypothetical protein